MFKIVQGGLKGRNFNSGKNLLSAVMCAACHHFLGDGGIIGSDNGKLLVMTNPFAPSVTLAVEEKDIKSKKDCPVSMMPPGLINSLNEEELKDLLAYLLSGGNDKDKMFAP